MSPPVFLTESAALTGDRVVLGGAEGRHAATVRRLRPGERADLTDGAGLVAECVVVNAVRDGLELDVVARRREPAPAPRLTVVQALPKGDRGELAVETMTEVGVDEVVPWAASRCVTQWRPERREKSLGRWRSTARAAAKQARRAWFPEVADLASTAEVADRVARAACALILHEEARTPIGAVTPPEEGDILLVVGPEGGITEEEIGRFAEAGGVPIRLGPTVLRTSTAGVVAASVLLSASDRW